MQATCGERQGASQRPHQAANCDTTTREAAGPRVQLARLPGAFRGYLPLLRF